MKTREPRNLSGNVKAVAGLMRMGIFEEDVIVLSVCGRLADDAKPSTRQKHERMVENVKSVIADKTTRNLAKCLPVDTSGTLREPIRCHGCRGMINVVPCLACIITGRI